MRKWAYFSEPISYGGSTIHKVMLYQKHNGETYVFLFDDHRSQICCADEWYPTLQDALSVWDFIPHSEWSIVDDPIPGCQDDAIDPIRIKGRAEGKPEYGKYEILISGEWREYKE